MTQSKPQFRTVDIALPAPFEGWTATMKAEGVSARILIELQSNDSARAMKALSSLIVKHNFLDDAGLPAPDLLDAPMDALTATVQAWSDAVAALPPR